IRWTTPDEVAIGPIKTSLEPTHQEHQYNKNEVILSLSGFSPESTHVIFSKDEHSSIYGAPPYNRGVFAKITGGRRTLLLLTEDDHIKEVEPVIERRSIIESAAVTDLNTILEDGN
ncbi:MAG TPA: methanogenesis marker 3 protein, partial [Methanobacteriales archaeon]|nr:methanogenesis marker 3 protein [Methanobacteriales archaeon]